MNETSTFTDARDGKIYKAVKIGSQIWMADNLNFKINNSWFYKNRRKNGKIYGRLYTWEAALKACPPGWNIPTVDEWHELIEFLGSDKVAGGKMKTIGTVEHGDGLWKSPNKGGTNESGFSALPGGYRFLDGSFDNLGMTSFFWSSTENDTNTAHSFFIVAGDTAIARRTLMTASKYSAHSVRCLMNLSGK